MTWEEYNKLFHKEQLNLVAFKRLMDCDEEVLRLVNSAIKAEREAVANWIMGKGFATGHGDDIVNMLDELEWQVAEHEREACAECGANGGHALYCVACAEKFIAQTETKDEPVAIVISESGANVTHSWWHEPALPIGTKLYTSPQRTWVGLTEEDLKLLSAEYRIVYGSWVGDFAKGIEDKLKESNT
jgi:hypothetical protein